MSTKSGDELNLWHLPLRDTSLHNRRDVHTLSMNCNCGESAVFCTQRPSTCRCTTKACQRPCPGTRAESRRNSQQLQLWETTVSSTLAPENLHDPHTGDIDHLVRGMQLRNHSFLHCLTKALSFAHQRACRRPTQNCAVESASSAQFALCVPARCRKDNGQTTALSKNGTCRKDNGHVKT